MRHVAVVGLVILFLGWILSGCTLANRTIQLFEDPSPTAQAPVVFPTLYEKGLREIEKENWVEAQKSFEAFLQKNPTTPYTQVANFNLGYALENQARWSEAATRYRGVATATTEALRLQTQALYRLSYCLEAMADDTSLVATLVDVYNRREYLAEEISSAQLPARLASAYSRVGNFDVALRYYAEAEGGLARYRRDLTLQGAKVELAQTLYQMGRISLRKATWSDFEPALRPIGRVQIFLLQAVEMDVPKWSDAAKSDLVQAYQDLLQVLTSAQATEQPDKDILQVQREIQEQKWIYAELVLEKLRELKNSRAPGDVAVVKNLMGEISIVEARLQDILEEQKVGQGLTAEAQARKDMIRGRVLEPNATLERQSQKASRHLTRKLPAKKKTKSPGPAKDPNL